MTVQSSIVRDEYISYVRLEKNYSFYTVLEYEKDVDAFLSFLEVEGIKDLNEVTYPEARLYATELYDKGLSRASISRKVSSIRSFFKFANARYGINDSAFRSLHHPKKEERLPAFFYEEEMELLFSSCDGQDKKTLRDYALLELLYATGIRVSELTSLKMQDIDDHLGIILVMGKGRKERYVPFGSFAQSALDAYREKSRLDLMKQKEHDMLFVNLRGDPLTDGGVRHILSMMMERASLHSKIYPHMIRHSFATHLLAGGADMRTVQELLGHSHLSSTQVYTHITKEHLRKTYMNTHPRA
ncbi:tyrosine recombinase XerC [Sporosarcina sp. JAI121]|uniref:tyrosine recombinase XerC n=1 Tax=Sporosarcina sp. JAI121 TaxID=2723064 RepID=UPI0015C8608E|nr:tyrosine recombinase XerC [Sporosarcina sp. JAI121]NYF24219.1 integrase/recombinase XerC [Sporosarcina sp. JAI121]